MKLEFVLFKIDEESESDHEQDDDLPNSLFNE